MKTKILVLAVLLFGGLLFTSCQKDDALLENKATENQYVKDNFIEDEAESTLSFNLHNYPDPFNATTTIEYRIPCCTFVTLTVVYQTSEDSQFEDLVLVQERQNQGTHTVEFDATDLPDGVYYAKLQVGNDNKICIERMTKDSGVDYILPDIH